MKKTKLSAVLSTAVVCYVFWLLITGQVVALIKGQPAVQVLILGAVVCVGAALFSARFFIHEKSFYLWNPIKLVLMLVYCLFVFMWELTKANIDVAKRALSPSLPIHPGIVKVPVGLKSEYGLSMLANSITLTPGTITMDVVDQDEQTYFYIHWIDVAETDGEKAGDMIKGTLEKWIGRIWK